MKTLQSTVGILAMFLFILYKHLMFAFNKLLMHVPKRAPNTAVLQVLKTTLGD